MTVTSPRVSTPSKDPARRPAALRRALDSVARRVRPPVTITDPPADVVVERDVEVALRDGVRLRVNVFRPPGAGPFPVLVSAHPYGKDNLPRRRRFGRGYRQPLQYRLMLQAAPFTHSAWTGWEAPDPAHWTARGYVVVNADLRGWGRSEGRPTVLSDQEGLDVHDLVEWAAAQPWSTGRVGMSGVSYLAMSQWSGAATRPPHLAAICPWEGLTDFYRDFARPGGVREDGFILVWSTMMRRGSHGLINLRREQRLRVLDDAWWAARDREIEKIDVPALICGSFSDHDLHTRGSFEAFRRIASEDKWLYTHRGPKWATYYSPEALGIQERFFDQFLRGDDTGILDEPRVRVEVREDARTVTAIRGESAWPPPGAQWRSLHLDAARGTLEDTAPGAGSVAFDTRRGHTSFTLRFDRDTEMVGPMAVRLFIELPAGGDVSLFVGVRKRRHGREVGFEGSYGFGGDLVTHGMLTVSQRALDPSRSRPAEPCHPHDQIQTLAPGEIVPVDIGLLPQATLFRAGEELRLDVRGRWFFSRNPLTGQFPAGYRPSPPGTCVIHTGGPYAATLTIPMSTARRDG